jgi:hypothetical protein
MKILYQNGSRFSFEDRKTGRGRENHLTAGVEERKIPRPNRIILYHLAIPQGETG